jgi:hypothetical protein
MDCTHFVTFLLCSKPFEPATTIHLLQDYARQMCASNENRRPPRPSKFGYFGSVGQAFCAPFLRR